MDDDEEGSGHGYGFVFGLLGAVASIVTIVAFVINLPGALPDPPWSNGGPEGIPCSPEISLSRGAGPSGTNVTITGTGFFADEPVDTFFHAEALTPARTDADGRFQVDVVIPGTLDPFAPSQFSLSASTGGCADSTPFQLESR